MKTAYLKMHLAIFLWGFTGLLGKLIALNEGMLVWYRLLISSIAIALLLLYRKKFPRLSWKEVFHLSRIGFLVMLHWVTFYGAIKLSSISVAMICLSSIALFASILEPLVNKTRFDPLEIFFSALAVTGISTIYNSDITAAKGIVLGIISSVLSASFSIMNKRITNKYDPLAISLVELSSGWLLLTLLFPVYFLVQPTTDYIPTAMDFVYLLVLSLLCTVFTWVLSLQALRKVSAYTMGLALNLEPVYGIILAIAFAGEGKLMNRGFVTGAGIILLTIALHTLYKLRRIKHPPENAIGPTMSG
jgi:drug/metabolite transporter (DMT)-like permease